jgi:hypothetical protein
LDTTFGMVPPAAALSTSRMFPSAGRCGRLVGKWSLGGALVDAPEGKFMMGLDSLSPL